MLDGVSGVFAEHSLLSPNGATGTGFCEVAEMFTQPDISDTADTLESGRRKP